MSFLHDHIPFFDGISGKRFSRRAVGSVSDFLHRRRRPFINLEKGGSDCVAAIRKIPLRLFRRKFPKEFVVMEDRVCKGGLADLSLLRGNRVSLAFTPSEGRGPRALEFNLGHPNEFSELAELLVAPEDHLLSPFRLVAFRELFDLFFVFDVGGVCFVSESQAHSLERTLEVLRMLDPVSEEDIANCLSLFPNLRKISSRKLNDFLWLADDKFLFPTPLCGLEQRLRLAVCLAPKKNKCTYLFASELMNSICCWPGCLGRNASTGGTGLDALMSSMFEVPDGQIPQLRYALELKICRHHVQGRWEDPLGYNYILMFQPGEVALE